MCIRDSAHAIQRVEEGSVSILYISPESFRSKTIERLLVGRKVVRFVIDEAHCFSAWGQDFRVDYLYIGDFIRLLQEQKGGKQAIPVSCFTATAKQNVIQDIKDYFFEKLNIRFKTFCSGSTRKNLKYKVFKVENEDEKSNIELLTKKSVDYLLEIGLYNIDKYKNEISEAYKKIMNEENQ